MAGFLAGVIAGLFLYFILKLLALQEGITVVGRRGERFFHRADARPPCQVTGGAGLVVRSRGAASAKRLLTHDRARRLVVDVEIPSALT